MAREDFENAELHDRIPLWQRGEMAVVADPDACDEEPDDELPDTIPETRPLGAQAASDAFEHDGASRER